MKVFLTGATGFVGRNVLEWLLVNAPEVEIHCLVRNQEKAETLPKNPRVKLLHGDLLAPETYQSCLLDTSVVIHTAALVSLKNGPEFYAANVDATDALLKASKQSRCLTRFVFVGSISAYERDPVQPITGPITEETVPHPSTDYGKSKLIAHEHVQTSGMPFCVVVPSYIFGPYPRPKSSMDRIIYDVRDEKRYTTLPLPGRATAIYAPDLAEAIWLGAMRNECLNETFFAGNPDPLRVGDAYSLIATALGKTHAERSASDEAMQRLKRYVYKKRPDEAFVKVLFEDYFWASCEKLHRLTGWRPRHTLAEGITETIRWYRKQNLL